MVIQLEEKLPIRERAQPGKAYFLFKQRTQGWGKNEGLHLPESILRSLHSIQNVGFVCIALGECFFLQLLDKCLGVHRLLGACSLVLRETRMESSEREPAWRRLGCFPRGGFHPYQPVGPVSLYLPRVFTLSSPVSLFFCSFPFLGSQWIRHCVCRALRCFQNTSNLCYSHHKLSGEDEIEQRWTGS